MWTVAALNKKFSDPLGTYNSLHDPHLHRYFRKPRIRQHLIQVGLLTANGQIVPDAIFKLQKLETERRLQLQELLKEAIESGVANKNGLKKLFLSQDLESEVRSELVYRAKQTFDVKDETVDGEDAQSLQVSKSKNHKSSVNWFKKVTSFSNKRISRMFSPKPTSRQQSLPGRKKKWQSSKTKRRPISSYGIRSSKSSNKVCPGHQTNSVDNQKEHLDDADELSEIVNLDGQSLHDSSDDEIYGRKLQSSWAQKTNLLREKQAKITLQFNGFINAKNSRPRNVKILQQLSCGGNPIVVFNGLVAPGERFTFATKTNASHMFCLTVLVDGIRDLRISTCCQHKHKRGSRISHFTIVAVEGGEPCRDCRQTRLDVVHADGGQADRGRDNLSKQVESAKSSQRQTSDDSHLSDASSEPSQAGSGYRDEFEAYESSVDDEPASVVPKERAISTSSNESDVLEKRFETVHVDVHADP